MSSWGLLVAVAAGSSTSIRTALTLTALSAATVFLCKAVWDGCRLERWTPPLFGGVLGVGIGGGLHLLLQGVFPEATLADTPFCFALWGLCGTAATAAVTPCYLIRVAAACVVTGTVRELLAAGTVWGWPLPFDGVSASFGTHVGGLLVAAGVVWALRFGEPHRVIPSPPLRSTAWTAVFVTAVAGVVGRWLLPLSSRWQFWWSAAITVLLLWLLTLRFPQIASFWNGVWVAVPLAVQGLSGNAWWMIAVTAVAAGVSVWLVYAHNGRLRRLPASFGGAPAALTIAAFTWAAVAPL